MKWILAALVLWLAWKLLRPAKKRAGRVDAEKEARAILGVRRDADADAIRAAHRRLMADAHPDRGGSAEEARSINAARDTLLARLGG